MGFIVDLSGEWLLRVSLVFFLYTGLILGLCPANERRRYYDVSLAGHKPRIIPVICEIFVRAWALNSTCCLGQVKLSIESGNHVTVTWLGKYRGAGGGDNCISMA